ncbi:MULTISPECIES: cytochrome c1 [Vibrio]|uniref:Ubiquinol--cytochrome c reductase cytochrome c1 subunit n=1 Tax=Vibrio halioticoli NBRC 102217 TaxID=1219072 RepID=V5EZF6_9VIBR|nr:MULTISPECIES: cytochrome c1 [Vibrio]MPW36871.1 cytochrome c1 [Vibrio sp. B1Z05]GAD88204.1 ubiquinol--cytochrome c reductase cytochrome c1 subunit [Vibrio halioticoli NBRC 102217]
MKKLFILLFALVPALGFAAGGNFALDKANNDIRDKESLQRGAQTYMNYCFACHSTQYQRYERVATDLDIPIDLMRENLMFDSEAVVGDLMVNNMPAEDAAKWFGVAPPDLTLTARVRGVDWLYTYLRSFYEDPSRPFGVNNVIFPSVGMPHVLQELQGVPQPVFETHMIDGQEQQVVVGVKADATGELSQSEYDDTVRDLVNFLEYAGDPVQVERENLGIWVLLFLTIFTAVGYLLYKEYWRDIH